MIFLLTPSYTYNCSITKIQIVFLLSVYYFKFNYTKNWANIVAVISS